MRRAALLVGLPLLAVAAITALLLLLSTSSDAQKRRRAPAPEATPPAASAPVVTAPSPGPVSPATVDAALPKERLEADVSTRSVAVTSTFSGRRIVMFGAVVNSRQESGASGYYDLVVVLEGEPGNPLVRMKRRVAGIWLNTDQMQFTAVPSYYYIVSTRPLEDIADAPVLAQSKIGFEHVAMTPSSGAAPSGGIDLATYRAAVTRLKRGKGLYGEDQFGVSFLGRGLFRATVDLPPNTPIGTLTARFHLFRDGELLDTFRSRVVLQREGLGNALHSFAIEHSLLYGIATVLAAVALGLAAGAIFSKSSH